MEANESLAPKRRNRKKYEGGNHAEIGERPQDLLPWIIRSNFFHVGNRLATSRAKSADLGHGSFAIRAVHDRRLGHRRLSSTLEIIPGDIVAGKTSRSPDST